MSKRLELHEKLVEILGSTNVYFQPPSSHKMVYPCIVYRRSNEYVIFASNTQYNQQMKRYTVAVIDKDPDSDIPDKVGKLPYCTFDRHYTTDNLNHDVYSLYF
jgi:hypothetical protein